MIDKTISYLKKHGKAVFFDAEHFFDGYKKNALYAMRVVKAAVDAGAELVVLCDTNGGVCPMRSMTSCRTYPGRRALHWGSIPTMTLRRLSRAASWRSEAGCRHVQGTVNGYGERCGNANLCSIIPNVILKMGGEGLERERLGQLKELSLFVDEMANFIPDKHRPYVGESAFATKGGSM